VWSTRTAGYASFVIEPEQHSFCANAASALPLSYAADVSIMQIKLKWDRQHSIYTIQDYRQLD